MHEIWVVLNEQYLCKLPFNDKRESKFKYKENWLYICHENDYTDEILIDKLLAKELACLEQ